MISPEKILDMSRLKLDEKHAGTYMSKVRRMTEKQYMLREIIMSIILGTAGLGALVVLMCIVINSNDLESLIFDHLGFVILFYCICMVAYLMLTFLFARNGYRIAQNAIRLPVEKTDESDK